MDTHTKPYDTLAQMMEAAQIMGKFQSIHNLIRNDYLELLSITDANKTQKASFDALYRASLRSLFSLIEADISGLNALDGYKGYDDRKQSFFPKFKKTYIQIAKTWNKVGIQQKYFAAKITDLIDLKNMRDELVHPKEYSHIHEASDADLEKLEKVFHDYDDFVNELMDNFFVGTSIKVDWNNK